MGNTPPTAEELESEHVLAFRAAKSHHLIFLRTCIMEGDIIEKKDFKMYCTEKWILLIRDDGCYMNYSSDWPYDDPNQITVKTHLLKTIAKQDRSNLLPFEKVKIYLTLSPLQLQRKWRIARSDVSRLLKQTRDYI